MGFFTWKDSFCIGIQELDAQHRSFLECLNECYDLISADRQATVGPELLSRLKGYAAEHFRDEEEMMRRLNYPGMDDQEHQHRYFELQIAQLEETIGRGDATGARTVMSFLRDWFLEHVLVQDNKFAATVAAARKDERDRPLGRRDS